MAMHTNRNESIFLGIDVNVAAEQNLIARVVDVHVLNALEE